MGELKRVIESYPPPLHLWTALLKIKPQTQNSSCFFSFYYLSLQRNNICYYE